MAESWVLVLRTGTAAGPGVRAALERAGIPVRTWQPRVQFWRAPDRRALEVRVPADDVAAARRVLRAHLAEGEANIAGHLRRLPGELCVGLGVALALGGPLWVLGGGHVAAFLLVPVGVLVAVAAARWLRRHPRDEA